MADYLHIEALRRDAAVERAEAFSDSIEPHHCPGINHGCSDCDIPEF